MKKILFPTDFSDNARNAINYGLDMFGSNEVAYTLFHVTNDDDSEYVKQEFNKIQEMLERKGVPEALISCVPVKGELTQAIDELLETINIDMIIMGTKGANKLNVSYLGTNTSNVIQATDMPLITVPQFAKFGGLNKVVFAADFNVLNDDKILDPLKEITRKYSSELLIFNVFTDGQPLDNQKSNEALQLNNILADIKHTYHFAIDIDVSHAIDQFAKQNQAELVTVINRKSDFMSYILNNSNTKVMAATTMFPLLVLKDN